MNNIQEAYKYADDIVQGNITAGLLIKQACIRFQNDLKDPRFEFREDQVNRCLKFLNIFKHYTGKSAGQ